MTRGYRGAHAPSRFPPWKTRRLPCLPPPAARRAAGRDRYAVSEGLPAGIHRLPPCLRAVVRWFRPPRGKRPRPPPFVHVGGERLPQEILSRRDRTPHSPVSCAPAKRGPRGGERGVVMSLRLFELSRLELQIDARMIIADAVGQRERLVQRRTGGLEIPGVHAHPGPRRIETRRSCCRRRSGARLRGRVGDIPVPWPSPRAGDTSSA